MENAILTLDGHQKIEGTADAGGEYIRFTPISHVEPGMLSAGNDGQIEINGKREKIKLEGAGPAYSNGTGTLMTLRRVIPPV